MKHEQINTVPDARHIEIFSDNADGEKTHVIDFETLDDDKGIEIYSSVNNKSVTIHLETYATIHEIYFFMQRYMNERDWLLT